VSDEAPSALDPVRPTDLRRLLSRHGVRPRRSLGQTFLTDRNLVQRIVAATALTDRERVIEIGAGAGAVTRELANHAKRLIAVEIDPKLIAVLHETVDPSVEVVHADVLTIDWEDLLGPPDTDQWRLVANIPYAITGPAIIHFLEAAHRFELQVIMVQQEVADRLLARPGERARGILTALIEGFYEIAPVARVPRTCFRPRPRVDSTILRLTALRPPLVPAELKDHYRLAVQAAYSARRKTLANALPHDSRMSMSKEEAVALLSQSDIEPGRRAETLTAAEFLALAKALAARS